MAEHRGGYYVRGTRGDRLRMPAASPRRRAWGGMPAVGDWVRFSTRQGTEPRSRPCSPRRTKFSRKTPWLKAEEHILVANVDMLFLVAGLDQDFNPRWLKRYRPRLGTAALTPVVVLTKLDLCDDLGKIDGRGRGIGVPCSRSATSRVRDRGGPLAAAACTTFALLGSSSAGKSTLNRLAGRTLMPTADLRRDGRGRTTRHRQLLVLRDGSILVDMPGLRESRSGRATSTAPSRTSPSSPRSAGSTTAHTAPSPVARW